jgi:HAD superfamily hydrolase (TIGR01549 family)
MSEVHHNVAGIVWDFDGTLLDSFKLQESVLTEVLERRSMPVPAHELFVHNYHGRLIDSIQGICGVEGDLLQEIYEDFIQSEERHYENPDDLFFPDALDLLKRSHAAGLKQIIVSNRPHHSDSRLGSPRNLAKREPLADLVDIVVCGDDNAFHKPDARMLDVAEHELGLSRKDLLVVGDQFVDAEMAHNLGTQAVLVSRDGENIPHLDRLTDGWQSTVQIVSSLAQVFVTKS